MKPISSLLRLQEHHALKNMTLEHICQYIRLVQHLKDDILLAQPAELTQLSPEQAHEILPPTISLFLSNALNIPQESMQDSWEILKDHIWECQKVGLMREDYEAFKLYGWKLGLSMWIMLEYILSLISEGMLAALTIFPPHDRMCCTNQDCENFHKLPLKKEKGRPILVFTLADGVQPAWAICLICLSQYILICSYL